MKTILLTGGIGSGKSAVANMLESRGIPVYDSDSAAKRLYTPGLLSLLERRYGGSFSLGDGSPDFKAIASLVFSDPSALQFVESWLYPLLKADFMAWRDSRQGTTMVVFESAVALSKPLFDDLWDQVVVVEAPLETRIQRIMRRDSCTRGEAIARIEAQSVPERYDSLIVNGGSMVLLERAVDAVFFRENC